ncbi:MAG: trimethylamine methyltransferase family protein [Euryarchaeota archaeon]|nr:trimethylamine methyltransferase family protein [Euryarchaeota archaeon]
MREGVLVKPYERLEKAQIEKIHEASLSILRDPGIISYNREAAEIFADNGAEISSNNGYWRISIPEGLIEESVKRAPSVVKLGARDKENSLILDGKEPRVRFGTGSEANVILDMDVEDFVSERTGIKRSFPFFQRRRGTVQDLCQAAHLCEHLQNVDFFIRTVNIQDEEIIEDNKDINKFYASLNNTKKHVMAGLTNAEKLDDVIRMVEIISGGRGSNEPIISFITCVTKSPLQLVEDTTQNLIEIAKRGYPVSVSTSPQGGSTAPLQEAGMLAQLNAEILAGITLAQLVRKHTPVLYGSVPLRVRMDNLDNMYGAPETNLYNMGGVQMARFYEIPCYSTAGVGDSKFPGIEASTEKLLSHLFIALSGAQYIHYAFGLLEGTNTFSPEQAVLDDVHIGIIKSVLKEQRIEEEIETGLKEIREVIGTSHKMFTRYARKYLRAGEVIPFYPFEGDANETLIKVRERKEELLSSPVDEIPEDIKKEIFQEFDVLERIK